MTRAARLFAGVLALTGCGTARVDTLLESSARWVTTPSRVAALSQTETVNGVPGGVTFGAASGRNALYLEFSSEWRAHGAPLKGFVVLEPRPGQIIDSEPITVEVWRVRATWRSEALHTWSDKPELAPPYAQAVTSSSPARALRIDITDLLRFAAEHPALDHGFALIARRGSGAGATFDTGMSGGRAPRLELYTR